MEEEQMKKRIVVLGMVMVILAGCLTGCKKKTECFYCGEEKKCSEKTLASDEKVFICNDCEKELKSMMY